MTAHRLVIYEPRLFLAEMLCDHFRQKRWFQSVQLATDLESVLKHVATKSEKFHFLLGGSSYIKMINIFERLATDFPEAKFIFMDDLLREGFSFVVNRATVHACFSLYDSQMDCSQCMEKLLSGQAALTPKLEQHLTVRSTEDLERDGIEAQKHLEDQLPHSMNERQWACFQHLVSGGELETLAERLNVKTRTARNLKYDLMNSFKVDNFVQLLRLAHKWGFLDHETF